MSTESKVTELWVGVIVDADGAEKIYQYIGADGISALMVSADQSRMNMLRTIAEQDAKRTKKTIEIRKYTSHETVEVIKSAE